MQPQAQLVCTIADSQRLLLQASFTQWIEQDSNFTLCDNIEQLVGNVEFGVLQACSQVVAGTNYGIRYLAQYTCLIDDESALAEDSLVLNTVVYVPLPTNGVEAEPQVSLAYYTTVQLFMKFMKWSAGLSLVCSAP